MRGIASLAVRREKNYKKPGMLSGANEGCLSRWGRALANVRCAVKILSMRRLASGIVWYYANDTEERRKAKSQRQKERRNGRKGKQRDLDLLVAWKSLTKKRAVKDCIVCGKESSNRRRHYCSEKCRMIGAAYATTLSHYLAGDIRSCPTWDEWVERHME